MWYRPKERTKRKKRKEICETAVLFYLKWKCQCSLHNDCHNGDWMGKINLPFSKE